MPVTYKHVSIADLEQIATDLLASAEKLTKVVEAARVAKNPKGQTIPTMILEWSDERETAISTAISLGGHATAELDDRVSCWKRGVLCKREKQLLKSKNDVASRRRREAAKVDAGLVVSPPPKKRGRPSKGPK